MDVPARNLAWEFSVALEQIGRPGTGLLIRQREGLDGPAPEGEGGETFQNERRGILESGSK